MEGNRNHLRFADSITKRNELTTSWGHIIAIEWRIKKRDRNESVENESQDESSPDSNTAN